jgi:Ribbon-helix-helix protein, copG family
VNPLAASAAKPIRSKRLARADVDHHDSRNSVPVSLLLPPDLVERVDRRAGEELISRSAWIRRVLASVLRPEAA